MSENSILTSLAAQAANVAPLGAKLKFVLDEQIFLIDGTGESNVVSQDDVDAACVISTTVEAFEKLRSGDLNPMMAVMSGQIKIKGDMGLAMKLQSLL